ncbi:MAG: LytTR family DNA-binding domain-containing protein [Bacteroidota bacterium]|jgi:two-component system LytT family response regulator
MNRPLTAVIVDDEDLARGLLREYLSSLPAITVIAECGNGFDAVKTITDLQPDIVFLDIQMPKLSGFEVLELLEKPPAVVFVTAFDQFALKAFDVHAVDYLLKPYSQERLREAVDHAIERMQRNVPHNFSEIARAARPAGEYLERILIKEGNKVHVFPAEKIDYIEAQDDYVSFRVEGKSYLKLQRLSELESSLDPKRFVRIHRSFLLNIERLSKLELYAKDSRTAILKDGTTLSVSRAGYDKLKELL